MEFFLSVIGLVMVIEGLPYFAFPDRMKQVLAKMLELPDRDLRRFGFFLMAAGIAVVYISKVFGR